MIMKKLFILLILLTSFLLSACSDDKERYVTIAIRGGNEFGSVSDIQIIRSFEGEDIDIIKLVSANKEGRYTIEELLLLEGSKLELRVFPGDKHEFDGFKGDLESPNKIGYLLVDGDKKVEVAFHFKSEILNEPKNNGSEYEVSHSSELRWIADQTTNAAPDNFAGKTIKMTDDIYMDGIAFEGIASTGIGENYAFAGTFDGEGRTIYDINIDSINKNNIGFIGNLATSGSVKNLSIKGKLSVSAGSYVGAVVGNGGTGNPTIENVFSKVDMTVGALAECYVGGIAGGNVSVSQSYNAGEIKLKISHLNTIVGAGIIGRKGIVNNCYNTGQISGYTSAYVAGIAGVGSAGNSIENSYNVGTLIVDNEEVTTKKGGIAIENYTIISSYFLSENGVNEGILALANSTSLPYQADRAADIFKFMAQFPGYDPTIWKMQSGLSAGNGSKNKIVSSRPVLIGLGEGK